MMDTGMILEPEGRCSVCHHVRTIHKGLIVLHHYTGTTACEGSYQPPMKDPPMTVTNFNDGGDY